ncbi:hypothetical protein K7H20_14000 [Salipiger manganoxidans]|uniref:hypothetical protein n=1 Tax=Salipiger marinus TaxID=555512 RepID=UPI001E33FDD5|nr:hypothetical protein [Salipiger manganoxidans]MCD1619179.1 hypothetical protein [Salipiger manganoxidans]
MIPMRGAGRDYQLAGAFREDRDKPTWTVARFPNGSWSYGGPPDSPEYAECEVWRIVADNPRAAVKEAQRQRRNMLRRATKTEGGDA